MIVILIPFFLVAQIPVEENAWKFGPEYTFQLTANLTANSENYIRLSSNTTALLRCRPKNSEALSCHLQIPETCKSSYDKASEINTTNVIKCIPLNFNYFEIKFNKSGIDNLIVEKNISNWNLNIIKAFINQLNIGANLNEKQNQSNFDDKENSTIGECKVNFKINHIPREQNIRKDNPFILDVLPLPDKVSKGNIEIEKIRNLKECTNFVNYLWANFGDEKENTTEVGLNTQLDSVTARMNITDTSFSSCTHTEATKSFESDNKKFKITEKIILTLKTIEAAKDKLPVIPNPGTTPIFIKMNVQELKV
ncbi:uncharacterized protein LOC127288638 [Leptopilina boulardi]|uniref:uncharacterized protein LOC127288638 n=1 Tax=Leptopilina boulardi TaxID=63433 RepID=UPI0021F52426|nr:uncharacterized protein LOC127288638 [Leptopilina boulardi]